MGLSSAEDPAFVVKLCNLIPINFRRLLRFNLVFTETKVYFSFLKVVRVNFLKQDNGCKILKF